MKKLTVSLSAASTNPFLNADGLLDFDKVATVYKGIKAKVEGLEEAPKPLQVVVVSTKAKPIKYSAASEKKDDLRYMTRRATKLAIRKRAPDTSTGKLKIVFEDHSAAKDVLTAKQITDSKAVMKAITSHLKKLEAVKTKVAKKRTVIRNEQSKVFETSLGMLQKELEQTGIAAKDMVTSKGMFGTQMLIKLGPENVVSVGASDIAKFRAAVKASKESVE